MRSSATPPAKTRKSSKVRSLRRDELFRGSELQSVRNPRFCLFSVLVSTLLVGCSERVPIKKLTGKYIASYPFGKETLLLNQDGTFAQNVELKDKHANTVQHGSWEYDARTGYVTLHGYLEVADGFGKLRADWQSVPTGVVALPVEQIFFKIVLNSGAQYPYVRDTS